MEKQETYQSNRSQVWFTSDLHMSHKNIIRHSPNRIEKMNLDMDGDDWLHQHNKWITEMWNNTVSKKDRVYILGDFSFANSDITTKILHNLNGEKHLIIGNHDKSSNNLPVYKSISQIKEVTFKQHEFSFLEDNFTLVMCHFPMLVWNRKHWGSYHIHGHSHGKLDTYNSESGELRVDVGIDSKLGNYGLVSLEQLYNYFKIQCK